MNKTWFYTWVTASNAQYKAEWGKLGMNRLEFLILDKTRKN